MKRTLAWFAIPTLVFAITAQAAETEESPPEDAAVESADAEPVPLPSPLSLEQALEIAGQAHPELQLAEASRERTEAAVRESLVENGLDISINLRPQRVRPAARSDTDDDWVGDDVWSLDVSKRLYDFGRTGALKKAGKSSLGAADVALADSQRQFRTKVMKVFFDVLLADLKAQRDDEAMSMVYVQFDKQRDRHELGEVSDVDLLAYESEYQNRLSERNVSRSEQSLARARLANILNRPGDLPSSLTMPVLPDIERPAPEFRGTVEIVLKNNPLLKQRKQELAAAELGLKAAKAKRYPVLTGQVSVADWEREFGSRNDAEASLNLQIPLYQGGEAAAAIAHARADLTQARANYRAAELALHEEVIQLTESIRNLKTKRNAMHVQLDYRDLYLERSRANYEMEVKTDLGDAMVQLSDAQFQAMETDFALELVWKALENLNGGSLDDLPAEGDDSNVL